MFPLHDKTRRGICRSLFAALCVLPTLGVLGWCISVNLPGHQTALERDLSRTLGMRVDLGRTRYPAPGNIRLEDVQITHSETGAVVLKARELQATIRDASLTVVLSQAEVDARQAAQMGELLERYFEDQLMHAPAQVHLLSSNLTLRDGEGARTLEHVDVTLDPDESGPSASIKLLLAGSGAKIPAEINLVRDRTARPPATRVTFDTGDVPLPCSMLLAPLQITNRLGDECHFHGRLSFIQGESGREVEWLAGHLTGVDLQRLVAEQFPHHLTGLASVQIIDARFLGGRLEEARGRVEAGGGHLGQSLLAAAQALGMQSSTADARDPLAYDQLSFGFEVQPGRVTIRGACDGMPGTVVTRGALPLVQESVEPQPILGLVQMMVPESQYAVPATRETDWLVQLLPIPQVVPPTDAMPRAARLRVSEQR